MQNINKFDDVKIIANHAIRYPEVRLIGENKEQLGVMKTSEALMLAKSKDMDLIEITSKSNPPVCCIGNINKYIYEQKQRMKMQKKQAKALAKAQELKEISLRPVTGEADLNRKISDADDFLLAGHKIRFSVFFKGRELSHMKMDMERLHSTIFSAIKNGELDGTISYNGNHGLINYMPKKGK